MARLDFSTMNKFNKKNYSQWHFKINCTLKAKGVFSLGLNTKLDAEAEIEKWGKDDAVAMFTIATMMEMKHMYLTESCC